MRGIPFRNKQENRQEMRNKVFFLLLTLECSEAPCDYPSFLFKRNENATPIIRARKQASSLSKRAFRAPEISLREVIRREGAMRECCACCKAFGESLYSVLAVIHEGLLFCRLTTLCKLTQETP